MRYFICAVVILIAFISPAAVAKEPAVGQAAFFYFGAADNGEDTAVYDDFSYYLNGISPWLEKQGVAVSFHSKAPFVLQIAAGRKLKFDKDDFELDLGFILIKPEGEYEIHYGVHTGVDIQLLVRAYFRPDVD